MPCAIVLGGSVPVIASSSRCRTLATFGIAAAITFAASAGAPTPLYRLYQDSLGLTPFLLTVIFAVYVLSLLTALLTVGSLSDYVGRRPPLLVALLLNILAMALFVTADSAALLVAARLVQGFANGMAITTVGAAILDADRERGPMLNSVTAFAGLALGVLMAALLATYAPAPEHLVYVVLLLASLGEILLLWYMPETVAKRPGAVASLRPHVHVPAEARRAFVSLTPVNIAIWSVGGFYLSLMPSLVRLATGLVSPLVGGCVVGTLMLSAAAAVLALRLVDSERTLLVGVICFILGVAVTLAGVRLQSVAVLMAGTLVAGLGFGAGFSGTIRTLLPLAGPRERAGLLAAFYLESYLAFALPAIAAGLAAPLLGLVRAAYIYGAAVLLLALASLAVTAILRRA